MNAWPTCSKKTGNTDDSPNSSVPSAGSSDDDSDAGSGSSSDDEDSDSGSSSGSSADSSSDDATPETRTVRNTPASGSAGSYTVKAGDTLSSIAASHGATWRDAGPGQPRRRHRPEPHLPGPDAHDELRAQGQLTHSSVPSVNSWRFHTGSSRFTASTSSLHASNA